MWGMFCGTPCKFYDVSQIHVLVFRDPFWRSSWRDFLCNYDYMERLKVAEVSYPSPLHCGFPLLWYRVKQFNNLRKVIWQNYSVSCPVIQIMYRIITISCKICLSCPWILHNQDPWNRFKMLMWRKVMDQVTLSFTELTSTTKVVVEALCVLSVILLLKANWSWQTGRQTDSLTDKPMYWEAVPLFRFLRKSSELYF